MLSFYGGLVPDYVLAERRLSIRTDWYQSLHPTLISALLQICQKFLTV